MDNKNCETSFGRDSEDSIVKTVNEEHLSFPLSAKRPLLTPLASTPEKWSFFSSSTNVTTSVEDESQNSIKLDNSNAETFESPYNQSEDSQSSVIGEGEDSTSDYLFQLSDFESAYAEISATVVSADQLPEYGMVVNKLPNEWVRKLPQVEDEHCQAPADSFSSSASSPKTGFHSALTARCEDDDRKHPKLKLENTSLDDSQTSTSCCRDVSITEPKVNANSIDINSDYLFGGLVPASTFDSTGANISSIIRKSAYRTSESSSCTMTVETVMAPTTDSSVVSTASKDRSSPGIDEAPPKPDMFFWKGAINSKEIGKFNVKALQVATSEPSELIHNLDFPAALELIGRIKWEETWNYIHNMRRQNYQDIVVMKFVPTSSSSQKMYSSFIRHMHTTERFAVVGQSRPVSSNVFISSHYSKRALFHQRLFQFRQTLHIWKTERLISYWVS